MANGREDGGFTIHLPLIISTLVVVLTVIGGFWSLADPRADLRNIRENYLSLREHEEFVRRFDRDIQRVEQADQEHRRELVTRNEFNSLVLERDRRITKLQADVERLMERLQNHIERDTDRFNKPNGAGK